jgi:FKBP-type peptidyl-prolyl cis-trans isomerase SlyD
MNIVDESVVSIHFTLKDDDGTVIDTSSGSEPLVYMHGQQNIIPGLEEALAGRKVGDKFQVIIPPEKGYGERDEALVQRVPRSQFPEGEIEPGMQFQVGSNGGPMVITVIEIDDKDVVIDGNSELAGETLHFDIEVAEVREATKEELEHGHAHGPGDHHHHH